MAAAISAYIDTFVEEASDLMESIESTALDLEARPGDAELINALFRAFHTLKGSAGVVGLTTVSQFTHHVENAVDMVRAGKAPLTPAFVSVLLASKDHIAALLREATGGAAADTKTGPALITTLAEHTAAGQTAAGPMAANGAAPAHVPAADGKVDASEIVDYLVSFAPSLPLDALGVAPADIIDGLSALGSCVVITPPDAPPGEDGAPATWEFMLSTSATVHAIKDVFVFIEGSGKLEIDQGLTQFGFDEASDASAAGAPTEAASEVTAGGDPKGPGAAASQKAAPTKAASADTNVRVSSERLDRLVKLIGELVTTQSRLQAAHAREGGAELAGPVEAMERLVADLRDQVLALRMVPIGTTFKRFQRLVRDISTELKKDVDFVTAGDETELDKTVTDQLGDALVHVLRNSMDHGLELPDVREAAGKPRRGSLRLSAAQEGSHVLITVEDDGRGVDAAAVRRKAEAQGLIHAGDVLSESDTIALIMRPGFSTATAVTQLSGRGVGMDVVKRTIEGLRGTISMSSKTGKGTAIVFTLPLTLAIIEGLLVDIGGDQFVLPLSSVLENLELTAKDQRAMGGRHVVPIRGMLVPYIRLRDSYGISGESPAIERVVVVTYEGQRIGLVVDKVIGGHQTVIQPLGRLYRDVGVFSGSTILGDGRVAMILDIAGTVRHGAGDAPSQRRAEAATA
jgi:two-component system chemotaxis sensor kinase CheA